MRMITVLEKTTMSLMTVLSTPRHEETSNSDSNYNPGKDESSSSSSDSMSDAESETGVVVENNLTSSSRSQKRDQPDTAEGVQSNKKHRAMKLDSGT
eukprot:scaffold103682_cov30-Attheya_sp.AAC.1